MSEIEIPQQTWLGVFAHPDDETSASAGTMIKWINNGHQAYVITATGGELGSLGTNGLKIARNDLPKVRIAELRENLEMYGVQPPITLGYRDQELDQVDTTLLTKRVFEVLCEVTPSVVVSFGPTGISNHPDHIAIHHATCSAYSKYITKKGSADPPILLYPSIPRKMAEEYNLNLSEDELRMDIVLNINASIQFKIQGLKNYRSQQDAQDFAIRLESQSDHVECFSVSPYVSGDWETLPGVKLLKSL